MISYHKALFHRRSPDRPTSITRYNGAQNHAMGRSLFSRHTGFYSYAFGMASLEDVIKAHAERRRIAALQFEQWKVNAAARDHNSRARSALVKQGLSAKDVEIAFQSQKRGLFYRGRQALPEWIAVIIREERDSRRRLDERRPEEWVRVCLRLDSPLRECVASIVWWDYFGNRGGDSGKERFHEVWPHLDEMIRETPPLLDPAKIERGLVRVGYSPWQAHRRMIAQ